MDIERVIKEKKGTVVDVRTPEEFIHGNVKDSVNIPLNEISGRIEDIRKLNSPLILCCASGGRSGMAQEFLTRHGIECINGGSWIDVNCYFPQTI